MKNFTTTLASSSPAPQSPLSRGRKYLTTLLSSCFPIRKGKTHNRIADHDDDYYSHTERKRYVHVPVHAASSFMRTTRRGKEREQEEAVTAKDEVKDGHGEDTGVVIGASVDASIAARDVRAGASLM